MKLAYRNQKNAEATAKYWNKPLDRPDWYKIESLSDDEAEIMLYDVIGWPFNDAAELVRTLAEMNQGKITVRINSPGGDVFDAVAIFNALRSHKSKIITRVESLAASAASFIALAGKEVHAYQNAMFMIHNSWGYTAGNQYYLREMADILEKIDENMVDIYAGNSNIGKKEIREMMKAETWLTAREAKEKGFVDTIIDGKAAKAQFDLSMFAHAPDDFRAEDREPTEREIERLLRDAGVPRNRAKAILAGCRAAEGTDEVAAEIKKTIAILGG
jgi:ATP-dependent protease ClpP protease subunit